MIKGLRGEEIGILIAGIMIHMEEYWNRLCHTADPNHRHTEFKEELYQFCVGEEKKK